tara:strand:- start:1271 stop:1759 length:489 start_codon:yes stop_codon:yes gene_type:complete
MKWTADGLFSSKHQAWETPSWLFDTLNEWFNFDCDAAASSDNALCDVFLDKEADALSMPEWPGESIWLNPPYGRAVGAFVAKAAEQAALGKTVVVLVFARTDTRWWHDAAMKAQYIFFIKGRLRFNKGGQPAGAAPAPSTVLVFNGADNEGTTPRMLTLERP